MVLFPIDRTDIHSRRAANQAESWIEHLARLGYAAKGVVYILVGGLSIRVAVGSGGRTTGSEGALQTILRQPFGRVLLAVVAVGLVGYALWRFVQAWRDPEGIGVDAKGIAMRTGYGISGLIHAGLALEAVRLAMDRGGGGGRDGERARHWTAVVMEQPLGRWAVGAAGLGIVAFGLHEVVKAYRIDLPDRLNLSSLASTTRKWVTRLAGLGLAARGIVFGLMGGFLIQAAWQYDPNEVRGLGGALASLRDQDYGPWLLGTVATGLVAYGVFEIVQARYRRIDAG